jgi:hypothetical protein
LRKVSDPDSEGYVTATGSAYLYVDWNQWLFFAFAHCGSDRDIEDRQCHTYIADADDSVSYDYDYGSIDHSSSYSHSYSYPTPPHPDDLIIGGRRGLKIDYRIDDNPEIVTREYCQGSLDIEYKLKMYNEGDWAVRQFSAVSRRIILRPRHRHCD